MGKTQRIKTEIGINKQINVELEQDFDFLEILSLTIQQEDVYTKSCADYGVVVGRVTANNGYGIPNTRVSVFIPIENQDKFDPTIFSIYPYKNTDEKNEDGYRYNLLPYEQSHSGHVPTGTFPSRDDVMVDKTAIEIYDKYYKYTVKTNDSGDFLIMGVPLGVQEVFVDMDLSDIGEFSLTPQDLIRMGRATEAQVAGSRFKSSTDLNSLPQIVSLKKSIDVAPLWGDPDVCQIAISRVDFDLRDDANIDIQPTSVFMGSMFSTIDKFRVRRNGKPRDNMGNLCGLVAGPGQILAIRQTINMDSNGRPVLEEYKLEKSGNVIDESGTWLVELPMNLDYVVTNEFGDKMLSDDPKVGIPTKSKYRFKIKWSQPPTFAQQVKRPYYLVPNIKEYGWTDQTNDPNLSNNYTNNSELKASYYFGLAWSGYGNTTMINEAVDCEDRFYEFEFNRVYTVSSFIDQYKSGSRGRFIGVKEIDDDNCSSTVNKFPVNDGFRNFDFLYFLFAIIFQIIQLIGVPILIIFHVLAFLWKFFAVPLVLFLIGFFAYLAIQEFATMLGAIAGSFAFGATVGLIVPALLKFIFYAGAAVLLAIKFRDIVNYKFQRVKVPMIQYPDCQACECEPESTEEEQSTQEGSTPKPGLLTQVSNAGLYIENITKYEKEKDKVNNQWWFNPDIPASDREDYYNLLATMKSNAISGWGSNKSDPNRFKINSSFGATFFPNDVRQFSVGETLPPGERINIFNTRKKYFDGENRIRVTFDYQSNNGKKHFDNTLTVLASTDLPPGTVVSFINPNKTKDVNALWSGTSSGATLYGIEGTSVSSPSTIQVTYASPNSQTTPQTETYFISTGTTETRTKYPSDIEYYQVITAITITKQVIANTTTITNNNWNSGLGIWGALNQNITVRTYDEDTYGCGWGDVNGISVRNLDVFPITLMREFENQKVLILQRGVDPYSPKVVNQYGIGKILGYSTEDAVVITATTHLNIPIQPLPSNTNISVQNHRNINEIYFSSNFFTPGSQSQPFVPFTTDNVGYYGKLDSTQIFNQPQLNSFSIINSVRGVQMTNWVGYTTNNGNHPSNYNRYYNINSSEGFYHPNEDLSGAASMQGDRYPQQRRKNCTNGCGRWYAPFGNYFDRFSDPRYCSRYNYEGTPFGGYYSKVLLPDFSGTQGLRINLPTKNIMRTDRLPSSDFSDNLEDVGFTENVSLLQQNLGFAVYNISTGQAIGVISDSFSTGAEQVTPDIEGQLLENNILTSMNTCSEMVSLKCYSGNGLNFGISSGCEDKDSIENGCYVFLNRPLRDLGKDLKAWGEWGFRFRFFYGLCRGVLAQSFMNNWVNGTLYAFPIQVDTFFDSNNKPLPPKFVKKLVYFDFDTNNFYFRSSPYYNGRFIGRDPAYQITGVKKDDKPVNKRNLLFPTTIMNLGMKDTFYDEIILEPATNAYVLKDLDTTSYSDTSDLVNLFVMTRITDEKFIQQLISLNSNNNLNQLFSRNEKRIDGDLAQLMSINCEFGVVPFSPEFYEVTGNVGDPVVVLGNLSNPTMGVFFSSTTVDLQNKDFITPGVINFRAANRIDDKTYYYGIKTQEVPFYQWQLNDTSRIFGIETNNWATSTSDIFSYKYQSLNRRNPLNPSYFFGSNSQLSDIYQRGYIFNIDSTGGYSISSGNYPNKFLVGAPFHFYFGLMKGNSALDKFKTKYSIDE